MSKSSNNGAGNNTLDLTQFLPYRFNNMAERISRAMSEIYSQQFDLSIPEWRVLVMLGAQEGLTAKQIGERTYMDKVKVSRAVNRLHELGAIDKHKDDNDQRTSLLKLSAQGKRLYRRIVPKVLKWEQQFVEDLSNNEHRELFKVLNKLHNKLSAIGY